MVKTLSLLALSLALLVLALAVKVRGVREEGRRANAARLQMFTDLQSAYAEADSQFAQNARLRRALESLGYEAP